MSTVITTAGEQLIAQKIGAAAVLSIDTIILANIPDLDVSLPVDRSEGKPEQIHVVHEYAIPEDFKGYVNPNQVVYSMLLGSEIGNFQFNWLGLYSSVDDVLVAVTHLPVTEKWQTDKANNTLGNNLTRNFLLEFSGAKAVTNITVEAKTWQVDFTARLRSIDERERLSNRDIYGRSCFFNDSFSVVKEGSNYVLKAGAGYVEGIRCVLKNDTQINVSALPNNVFLDVSLQQQGSDVVPVIESVLVQGKADFVDVNLAKHYLVKVAEISAAGVVTDTRRSEAVVSDLVEYLKGKADSHAQDKEDPHETMKKVATEIEKHTSRTDDPHSTLPKEGSTGDVLLKTESGTKWEKLALVPAGHIYPVPFPPNELPAHHYVPNGEGLLKTSDAGNALLSMSAAYKAAHRVTENDTHVFLPNVFDSSGDGYFPRFVDGVNRIVGSKQECEIQSHTHKYKGGLPGTNVSTGSNARYLSLRTWEESEISGGKTVFDTGGSETRPKNYGFTPAIYLPPLES